MASLPEPPTNVPRIVEVQSPATGHYVVYVRMPTNLAAKWPDKPWGTSIDAIGLSLKDSDLYPGYTLVDIESLKGSADLYWVFQKLDGPVWTTKTQGQDSLIPAKYRRLVTTTRTKQEVVPETLPSAITGDLVQSVVEQQDDTGKAIKVNTEETINANADPLLGSLTDQWGVNTTEESLISELVETSPGVFERSPLPSGFGIKSSRNVPLGDGKAIQEIEYYPPDDDGTEGQPDGVIYRLEDQDIDDTTGIIIDIDKRLVDASQAKVIAAALRLPQEEDVPESAWFTEIKALDKWHSILIASRVDPSTIPELETWNETAGFSLPNKLIEAGIIWDSKLDTDAGASGVTDAASVEANDLSWSVSAEAVVSGSLTGRPYTLVENGRSGSGQVTVERTYSYGPPLDNIVAHEFKPCYGTISLRGAQGYHKASGQQSGKGSIRVGDALNYRRQYDTDLAITQFGPVEAPTTPSLQFKGDHAVASPIISTTQTATTGTLPGTGYYPVAIASLSLEAVATLEWPGSSVPLGSGDSYILKVDVRPWRFGWWVKEVYTLTIPGATPP